MCSLSSGADSHNIKRNSVLLATLVLVLALAIFVFSKPPQDYDNKKTKPGFPELLPNRLGSSDPQIAELNNNIYFVLADGTGENSEEIYFRFSVDNGMTFSSSENLSDDPGNSTNPRIATFGNSTYVVWQDDTNGNNEIYFKISPAGKSGFGRISNLSRNDGNSTSPQIAAFANSTYVVWRDNDRPQTYLLQR